MIYLHMSVSSIRMMNTYTCMIRRNFPMEEHRFVYMDALRNDDRVLLEYGNSVEITGNVKERLKAVKAEMDKADVIIWHGIMFGAKRALIPVLYKRYMSKSVWVMRGIDLYNWKKEGTGIKTWLINRVNYLCRKGMPYVVAIFPTDAKVYQQQFGDRSKVFSLPYPIAESAFELMEEYRGTGPRPNGKIYIQVAHNAYAFNHHIDILNSIQPFAEENLRVIVPLSYGNDWYNQVDGYITSVARRARRIFGAKATVLKRLMPPDEYSELLCNVDISIYGSARQNGLGNILRSLYMGNKVYLSNKNPLYRFFRDQGIDVFETEKIKDQSYEEFISPSNSCNAVDWIRRTYYPDASAVYWKSMFDYFRDGKKEETPEEILQIQIDNILHRDFSSTVSKQRTKRNYINLTRYIEHPKGTQLAELVRVVIMGADTVGLQVFDALSQSNKTGTKWSIDGFADYQSKTLSDSSASCDVIGTPDDIEISSDVHYFATFSDSALRRRAVKRILEYGGILRSFFSEEAKALYGSVIGDGCILIGNTSVLCKATVGSGSVLKSCFVDCGAKIGEYCTLECGCWIGEGAVIGDDAVIGPQSKIAPGVRIAEGTRVPAFSIIEEDIL